MAARDLLKRLNRSFDQELKKMTLDTSGELPAYDPNPSQPVPSMDDPKPQVVPKPIVVPVVVPVVVDKKDPQPSQPQPTAGIRGELTDGVWVEFSKITHMGGKSRLHFLVINKNSDDFQLRLYHNDQTIVNESGEEMSVTNLKIGSKSSPYTVQALIVPDLPTEMIIEVNKLESVALFGMKDSAGHSLKLRNLK